MLNYFLLETSVTFKKARPYLPKLLKYLLQKLFQILKAYAQRRNMEFFECSAKTAEGVNKAFVSIAKKLIEKK